MNYNEILQKSYPVNRKLTTEDKNNQLFQNERLDITPFYNASTIKFNSTFMELVDRWFIYRGYVTFCSLFFIALTVSMTCIALTVPEWHLVPTSTDWQGIVLWWAICSPFWAYMLWILRKESFRWTHYPIRFNYRKRMVYVFCLDGVIRSAKWDDLFFTISRCRRSYTPGSGPQIWDIRGHALKADQETVEWTFALHGDSEDPRQLKNGWEFVRRYMEEGPKAVFGDVHWCHDVATRRETFREGLFALNLNLNGLPRLIQYVSAPVVWLISIGRVFAIRTSKIPQWPAEIEAKCRIDACDPYQRTAAQNPAKFPTDPVSVVREQISQ
ncbi:DUF6708 domain-containing protein [Caballeronia novacaledonica]|uniref:DUF6708 domain-containing protein n=1 Tax=Caballeronia novacaledonica TaxID=1544861 RepID=A0AA37I9Q2_9BURK|nr:DUF6708 domain-containing protein [Caballeronia novacaledonica]GJH25388.1 hypothetical protein CBA19CS42_12750 [Caballeronia novacaledonica]